MKTQLFNTVKAVLLLLIVMGAILNAAAQSTSMGAFYFQNQYLSNPAMAGSTPGLNVNIGYKRQWSEIPGSPTMQTLTGEYAVTDKVGLGVSIYNDQAGIFRSTRVLASYSYHLPLNNEGQKVSFGLSFGFMDDRISNEDINGDINDIILSNYNTRGIYLDGDFGISYVSGNFNVQAAVPNITDYLKYDGASNAIDRAIFFSAVSYRIQLSQVSQNIELEPKVCYRGIKGFDNILDVGANLSYDDNRINLFGMYHSLKNTTFGLGFSYQAFQINGMYTTASAALGKYTNGSFEIGLKLNLVKKGVKE